MTQEQKPIIALAGQDGSIFVYEDKVVIDRRGLSLMMRIVLEHNFDAYITLFYTQIVGVNLRYAKSDIIFPGVFQILLPNNKATANMDYLRADNYNINFKKKENETAQKVKAEIETRVAMSRQSTQSITQVQTDEADMLRKYKQLFDDGIISKEEYETKKKQILGI